MATRAQQKQALIRMYKQTTGKTEVNMRDVAQYATQMGWPLPTPIDPIERLAREFAEAAREEIRHDEVTGKPYRANHARTIFQGDQQLTLWVDIDEASRTPMLKCLIQKREQMVGEALQLSFDTDHWNRVNPDQEPIIIPLDLTDDVEWRKNSPGEEKAAS